MALPENVITNRLKEAFGSDTQIEIGRKIFTSQGNVSKLLSGEQQPTLETIYHVATAYDVSVDWLLGLTDEKRISVTNDCSSYEEVTKCLTDVITLSAVDYEGDEDKISFSFMDPLMVYLVRKSITLKKTDRELFETWKKSRLSLFAQCPLVCGEVWVEDEELLQYADQADTEEQWMKVYNEAKAVNKMFVDG